MKVKVGDKIYDGEKEPVMVIMTPVELACTGNAGTNCSKFCSYPDTDE